MIPAPFSHPARLFSLPPTSSQCLLGRKMPISIPPAFTLCCTLGIRTVCIQPAGALACLPVLYRLRGGFRVKYSSQIPFAPCSSEYKGGGISVRSFIRTERGGRAERDRWERDGAAMPELQVPSSLFSGFRPRSISSPPPRLPVRLNCPFSKGERRASEEARKSPCIRRFSCDKQKYFLLCLHFETKKSGEFRTFPVDVTAPRFSFLPPFSFVVLCVCSLHKTEKGPPPILRPTDGPAAERFCRIIENRGPKEGNWVHLPQNCAGGEGKG